MVKHVSALCFVVIAAAGIPMAQTVTMVAKDFDFGSAWEYRDAPYLGIKGTHVVLSGTASRAFPGESGTYKIVMGVQLEADGAPKYRVSAGGRVLKSGAYPYACNGKLYCENYPCPTTKNTTIEIGTHTINKGEKIERWGESTYPCPPKDGTNHGAYSRWKDLVFTRVGPTEISRANSLARQAFTAHKTVRAYGIDGRPVQATNVRGSRITLLIVNQRVQPIVGRR